MDRRTDSSAPCFRDATGRREIAEIHCGNRSNSENENDLPRRCASNIQIGIWKNAWLYQDVEPPYRLEIRKDWILRCWRSFVAGSIQGSGVTKCRVEEDEQGLRDDPSRRSSSRHFPRRPARRTSRFRGEIA